MRNLKRR